ncbi:MULTISPECIES: LysR family transcriptional regulator [unclassified Variovorax]|uniref:LysR family transcriptional regulator n=1 Tax=unclassified Variovorax TaxID=663243 RepID=UPI001BD2A712|nr:MULTISPECIES: LysR family transcriptional regulator [unclassified Variovorax]
MAEYSLPAHADVLDPDLLTVFCWVAQTRNFSRAADRLNTSQPVVTRKVGKLEEQLGVQLFVRTNRGCDLTQAGEILASRAPAVLLQLSQLREEVGHAAHVVSGTLSIGVTHLAGQVMVPQLLPLIAERWPLLRVNMVDADSRVLCSRLLSRELSLAVCYDPPTDDELICKPLFMEKLHLVGVPSDELRRLMSPTVRDLASLPLVLPSGPQTIRVLLEDAFAEIDMPLRPLYEATTVNLLRGMALQGTGYTVLSMGSVADDVAAGRLMAVPLADKGMSLGLTLVSTRHQLQLRNVQLMYDFVHSEIMSVVERGLWPGRQGNAVS